MLYRLEPLNAKTATIWVKENNKLVKRYFLWDRDDGSFLKTNKVQFTVHVGLSSEDIQNFDFLDVEFNMFVLAPRAYELLYEHLKQDVEFHTCEVFCEDEKFDFYIGKITTRRPLVDREKSTYWELEEGVTMLQDVVYAQLKEDFLLARDSENGNYYAASDQFIDLVNRLKLQIKGIPLPIEILRL